MPLQMALSANGRTTIQVNTTRKANLVVKWPCCMTNTNFSLSVLLAITGYDLSCVCLHLTLCYCQSIRGETMSASSRNAVSLARRQTGRQASTRAMFGAASVASVASVIPPTLQEPINGASMHRRCVTSQPVDQLIAQCK